MPNEGSNDSMTRAPVNDIGYIDGKVNEAFNVCLADAVNLVSIALSGIHNCVKQGYLPKDGAGKDSEASVIYRGSTVAHIHCRSIWNSPHLVQVDIFGSISQLFMLLAFAAVLA